ncbi:natural cytotoxicity triggering receptor 3-like [Pelobates cultripes]|uniref:Natural cytotoxicity triggering receptor 3 n=1 Tax=Pelobates cultripes TaxID=61616 RepID=A0AAD1SV02_PELCU|nr:natural cytotoxicity triggering receptor 3-like [Pelobates cultripes]
MEGIRLLVILGALQGLHSQVIHVFQIPSMSTMAGSTVVLECTYTITNLSESTNGWFTWYRHKLHGDVVTNTAEFFKGRVSRVQAEDFLNKKLANIVLHRVEMSDTGVYICEVSLLQSQVISGYGRGTFLHVTDSASTKKESSNACVEFKTQAFDSYEEVTPVTWNDFKTHVPKIEVILSEGISSEKTQKDAKTLNTFYNLENFQYTILGHQDTFNPQTTENNDIINCYNEIS